jgi:hypothetical protein
MQRSKTRAEGFALPQQVIGVLPSQGRRKEIRRKFVESIGQVLVVELEQWALKGGMGGVKREAPAI